MEKYLSTGVAMIGALMAMYPAASDKGGVLVPYCQEKVARIDACLFGERVSEAPPPRRPRRPKRAGCDVD